MTVVDPRLDQIAINISDAHKWLVRATWETFTDDVDHSTDRAILGVAEQLLTEVHRLITIVTTETVV